MNDQLSVHGCVCIATAYMISRQQRGVEREKVGKNPVVDINEEKPGQHMPNPYVCPATSTIPVAYPFLEKARLAP